MAQKGQSRILVIGENDHRRELASILRGTADEVEFVEEEPEATTAIFSELPPQLLILGSNLSFADKATLVQYISEGTESLYIIVRNNPEDRKLSAYGYIDRWDDAQAIKKTVMSLLQGIDRNL